MSSFCLLRDPWLPAPAPARCHLLLSPSHPPGCPPLGLRQVAPTCIHPPVLPCSQPSKPQTKPCGRRSWGHQVFNCRERALVLHSRTNSSGAEPPCPRPALSPRGPWPVAAHVAPRAVNKLETGTQKHKDTLGMPGVGEHGAPSSAGTEGGWLRSVGSLGLAQGAAGGGWEMGAAGSVRTPGPQGGLRTWRVPITQGREVGTARGHGDPWHPSRAGGAPWGQGPSSLGTKWGGSMDPVTSAGR